MSDRGPPIWVTLLVGAMTKLFTSREGQRLLGTALVLLVVMAVLLSLVQTHGLQCLYLLAPVLLVFAVLAPAQDERVECSDAVQFRAQTVVTTRSFQLPPPLYFL